MGILKFGVIGFMIICPFIYISFVSTQGDLMEYQQVARIEKSIEEASNDAAFVMKTYSESSYNSLDEYNIVIPKEDVIQVFFDSLDFRDFRYSKADFPILVFVEYDGVVLYNPREEYFYPKVFYVDNQIDSISYVNLSHNVKTIDKTSLDIVDETVDELYSEAIILKTLEKSLNRVSVSLGLVDKFVFELPESDNNFYSTPVNDLSFIAFYSNSEYYGIGEVNLFEIKPSGIMKMNSVLPIDI